jgi:hypothetical protein
MELLMVLFVISVLFGNSTELQRDTNTWGCNGTVPCGEYDSSLASLCTLIREVEYSNPSVYEQSVYEFSAQINTCFSIYKPIFANTSSFRSQTDRYSCREVMGNSFSFYKFSPYEQFWRNELNS